MFSFFVIKSLAIKSLVVVNLAPIWKHSIFIFWEHGTKGIPKMDIRLRWEATSVCNCLVLCWFHLVCLVCCGGKFIDKRKGME